MKKIIALVSGGLGKNIMFTDVAKNIKQHQPDVKLVTVASYPQAFVNNVNIDEVYQLQNTQYFWDNQIKDLTSKELFIGAHDPYNSSKFFLQEEHVCKIWSEEIFHTPHNRIVCPELFLTTRELTYTKNKISYMLNNNKPLLVFQPFGGQGADNYFNWNRDLSVDFAQSLADSLSRDYNVIHIAKEKQHVLNNTIRVTDINERELYSLVALADKILCIDSCVQHISAALKKQATVLWVTNRPQVFGYGTHRNICAEPDSRDVKTINAFLMKYDWTGTNHAQCWYNTSFDIFDIEQVLNDVTGIIK